MYVLRLTSMRLYLSLLCSSLHSRLLTLQYIPPSPCMYRSLEGGVDSCRYVQTSYLAEKKRRARPDRRASATVLSAIILANCHRTFRRWLTVCFVGEIFSPNSQWIIHIRELGEHTGGFARASAPRGTRGGENLPQFKKHFFVHGLPALSIC